MTTTRTSQKTTTSTTKIIRTTPTTTKVKVYLENKITLSSEQFINNFTLKSNDPNNFPNNSLSIQSKISPKKLQLIRKVKMANKF